MALRKQLWTQLAGELKPQGLEQIMSQELSLPEVAAYCENMTNGSTSGRALINLQPA
jgi:hypothetical protein